jgi:hypothetical protein
VRKVYVVGYLLALPRQANRINTMESLWIYPFRTSGL